MSGGPGPGSVRCTGGVTGLGLAWSAARVSRNLGMSGNSLCRGNEMRELVRTSHSWSSSDDVGATEVCGVSLGTSLISFCMRSAFFLLAVSIHSFAA